MKRHFILPCIAGLLIAGIVAFAYLHRVAIPVLNPQGPVAFQERGVIVITVLLSAIVVVPVFVLLFYFAWRYRATSPRANRKHQPNWDHDSWITELFWWLVPSAIIVFLVLVAWKSSHALDPYVPLQGNAATITVDVVALDWKWLFIYPQQGIASVNMLEIPANTPIHFNITADAPMNSFWIPSLGGQIMAMPGMQTQLNLLASTVGTYTGVSGNISGKGFAGMSFNVQSVTPDTFVTWVQSVQQNSNPLTYTTYAALSMPSEYVPPMTYAPIDVNVYTAAIMKYMAPTSMPNMPNMTP